MSLSLPVLPNSEWPWVYECLAFWSSCSNVDVSSISSVNFAQLSFYISDYKPSLNEQEKRKIAPRNLKFQHFDLIMISVSNFRSNFRNWAKPTLVEHPENKIVKSADERSERKVKVTSYSKTYNPGQKCWNTILKASIFPFSPVQCWENWAFYAEFAYYHTHCNIDLGGGMDMREGTVKHIKAFQILSLCEI